MDMIWKTMRHVHMIGIAGAGMSPLAQLLSASGVEVTGSDARDGGSFRLLQQANIQVYVGHDAIYIENAEAVISSPAIPRRNPELVAARAKGIRVFSRAEALSEFVRGRRRICVTGSHGKTTTTAMLAFVLGECGMNPGYMIGGISESLGGNAKLGSGTFVLEACEAFGALHNWEADHCIITNLDDEHSEHYGDFDGLKTAFRDFIGRVPPGGMIVACGDSPNLVDLCGKLKRPIVTYGFSEENEFRATIEKLDITGSVFNVHHNGFRTVRVELSVPGQHNVLNALASLIMANSSGLTFSDIALALAKFRGVERRCQPVAEIDGIRIYDDYAHHPTEVEASMAVARHAAAHGGRIFVAFEGQLHSRVHRLAHAFASALSGAECVALLPVDAAGEAYSHPSDVFLSAALENAKVSFICVPTAAQVATELTQRLQSGDVLIAIGAKQAAAVSARVTDSLRSRGSMSGSHAEHLSISKGPEVEPDSSGTLVDRFAENICKESGAVSATCGSYTLTYGELANHAQTVACRLIEEGVRRQEVVAVHLKRSPNRVVAFLGTMFAGAVYVPIDPATPKERCAFILSDASVRFMITDEPSDSGVTVKKIFIPDTPSASFKERYCDRLPKPDDAAYLIYTSGTSGTPKAVVVDHAALYNVARASVAKFNIGSTSRVSQISSFAFDIAMGDMAMALYAGATLVFPEEISAKSGPALGRFIGDTNITHLSLTPSALSTIPVDRYGNLTHIVVCGEKCPSDLASRWRVDYRFFNAYGPAEATVWCTVDECIEGRPITIGSPLDNVTIALFDEQQKPVAQGRTGEIWIAGKGLARGYLKRNDLTEERFRATMIGAKRMRAYRTGDLAIMLPDGRLQFLARVDEQIKLRGFRVEPGEIEETLRRHPEVLDAAVRLHKDAQNSDRLVAYLVNRKPAALSNQELVVFLERWLPSYMIPSAFVEIRALPRNQNQKLDYRMLENPFLKEGIAETSRVKAKTPTEAAIVDMLRREIPSITAWGVRENFSEIGLDSLQTAQIFVAIERDFNIQLPPEAFAYGDTIELLAIYVDKMKAHGVSVALVDSSLTDTIIRKQRGHFSAWTGFRANDHALICGHNIEGANPSLYWCFQGNREHEALAQHLGPAQPLYGMRSGHLVFRYKSENVKVLAERYADEMVLLQPEGTFALGGNCQGGIIVQAMAEALLRRGRAVTLLCLVGPTCLSAFSGSVALIFCAGNKRNPYLMMKDPERIFRAVYGSSYTLFTVPGDEDSQFREPNIRTLANIVLEALKNSRHTRLQASLDNNPGGHPAY